MLLCTSPCPLTIDVLKIIIVCTNMDRRDKIEETYSYMVSGTFTDAILIHCVCQIRSLNITEEHMLRMTPCQNVLNVE